MSHVPSGERFRTLCKGHGSGISTPTAESQVVSSLMKSDFLKGQPGVVLYLCLGRSSGVDAPLHENPGHQLDGHCMTNL